MASGSGVDRLAFGRELRRLRTTRGLSQSELAARAGIDPSYLGRVERGFYGPPTVSTIIRIARGLALGHDDRVRLLDLARPLPASLPEAARQSTPDVPGISPLKTSGRQQADTGSPSPGMLSAPRW
ncbi:MAG: helix-turn-helix transcriptional regulator [Chloroflexi bacterium]|nr:helix-turn-helix transcriptional regulator [Chloroflexota bacterium]